MARQEVGAWIVPTSSVDSSGFVPIKSKLRQRTVKDSACSPMAASCCASAAKKLEKEPLLVYHFSSREKKCAVRESYLLIDRC